MGSTVFRIGLFAAGIVLGLCGLALIVDIVDTETSPPGRLLPDRRGGTQARSGFSYYPYSIGRPQEIILAPIWKPSDTISPVPPPDVPQPEVATPSSDVDLKGVEEIASANREYVPPKVIEWPDPAYSKSALRFGIRCIVELQLVVSAEGKPEQVRLVTPCNAFPEYEGGWPLPTYRTDLSMFDDEKTKAWKAAVRVAAEELSQNAVDAASQWRWRPASRAGRAVAIDALLRMYFGHDPRVDSSLGLPDVVTFKQYRWRED